MAARAVWKGYLRLSLVNCAVALYSTTTETTKVHFHKLNPKTGNRLRMHMVDEATGEEVPAKDQVRGYEVEKGVNVVVDQDDIDKLALESTHILEIMSFTASDAVDRLYFDRSYFLAPDDKPSLEAFVVMRQAMERRQLAALSKIVMHDREHIVLLEPRHAGMIATILHWPYEMHDEMQAFADIPKQATTDADLLEVADTLVDRKMGTFDPSAFKDRYEEALKALVEAKRAGRKLKAPKPPAPTKPSDIMQALKASLTQDAGRRPAARTRPSRAATARPSTRRAAAKR
jgi:DNA end-binding protein Ku